MKSEVELSVLIPSFRETAVDKNLAVFTKSEQPTFSSNSMRQSL